MVSTDENKPEGFWERFMFRPRPERMSFCEKVQWHMKHDRGDLVPLLQDKYRVKDRVKKSWLQVADLLYVTEDPENIHAGSQLITAFSPASS